jgi:hypothetical protein
VPIETIRKEIAGLITGTAMSAKDISRAIGMKEKDVYEHLEHVAKSTARRGRFVVEPSECLDCGFVFTKRERLKTPSKCPVCRSEAITETRFLISEG